MLISLDITSFNFWRDVRRMRLSGIQIHLVIHSGLEHLATNLDSELDG